MPADAEQVLRVFTLTDGKKLFEGHIPLTTLPLITVVHGSVLYVRVRNNQRELVSVGAHAWTHPVTPPQIGPPLPAPP